MHRCASYLRNLEVPPPPASIRISQGEDPVTGRCISPILNEEARIAAGTDLRAANSGLSTAILQVNNTFHSLQSGPIAFCPISRIGALDATSYMVNYDTPPNEHHVSKIPVYPANMASVIRHWIKPCPNEGLCKTLVHFNMQERNNSKNTKKLYSNQKNMSLAFLDFINSSSIVTYEQTFCILDRLSTFLAF